MYFCDHNHFELLDAVQKHLTEQLLHKHEQHHDLVSDHRLQRQRQGFQGNLEGS